MSNPIYHFQGIDYLLFSEKEFVLILTHTNDPGPRSGYACLSGVSGASVTVICDADPQTQTARFYLDHESSNRDKSEFYANLYEEAKRSSQEVLASWSEIARSKGYAITMP